MTGYYEDMDERDYFLGFSVFPGIGPKRLQVLLNEFGSAMKAWNAGEQELISSIGKVYGTHFLRFRETFSISAYKQQLADKRVWFVTTTDQHYPVLLRKINNPPIGLFGKGESSVLTADIPMMGIVGTRKITGYGRQVTEMITGELVQAGCCIVSGLAMGVDAVAHTLTLERGGVTIGVLGSGVDVCHPRSNERLYQRIIGSGGAVISEFPLGEPPSKGSFPSRNRIIAGITEGIVVTEGAADSGALITAEDALRFGRNVFAVPGPITSSLSIGPNSLLAQGAKPVSSGRDIIQFLGIKNYASGFVKDIVGETDEEQRIIDILQSESLAFDDIVKRTGFGTSKTGILLSVMEMKGMIEIQEAGIYSLL
jgi:DNA processing protein